MRCRFLIPILLACLRPLAAQAPAYHVIDLGPQQFSMPGYVRDSTRQSVGRGALNNHNRVALHVVSNNAVDPNPTGTFGPLGGGKDTVVLWDRGFVRDLRWSLPGVSPINNPHLAAITPAAEAGISNNDHVVAQCETHAFGDPGLANFGPERCGAQQAVLFDNATRTWRLIGTLTDNTSTSPFTRETKSSAAFGVNAAGVAVGFSNRSPDPGELISPERAFGFTDANPASLISTNLARNLGVTPRITAYDAFNNPLGIAPLSSALAIGDTGVAAGQVRLGTAINLNLPLQRPGPPVCSLTDFPKSNLIQQIPVRFQTGGGADPVPLGELGNLCDVSGSATAVSSNGIIGGEYSHSSWQDFPSPRPFLIAANGSKIDIPIPAGAQGHVNGVNAQGHAVGEYRLNGVRVPFLYRGGNSVIDLRTVVPANPPGFLAGGPVTLETATAINDSGSITGNALRDNRGIAILLTEQPFCTVQMQFQQLPEQLEQGNTQIDFLVNVRQAGGNCNVSPVGELRIYLNNTLVQTKPITQRPENPLAETATFASITFPPGSNTVRVDYSGNGLYAAASHSQTVTTGANCPATVVTPQIQRGGFVLNPGNPAQGIPETFSQRIVMTNNTGATLPKYTSLQVWNLPPNVELRSPEGSINRCSNLAPAGAQYVVSDFGPVTPGQRVTFYLYFTTPNRQTRITYNMNLLAGPGIR